MKVQYVAALTSKPVASLTQSGGTASANVTAHGYGTGDIVTIAGANQAGYNNTFTIVVTDADNFTFSVFGGPASPATGSITATLNPPADLHAEDHFWPEGGISSDGTVGPIVLATNLDEEAAGTHLLAEDGTVRVHVFAVRDRSNPERSRWVFTKPPPAPAGDSGGCCGDCKGCGQCLSLTGNAIIPDGADFPSYLEFTNTHVVNIVTGGGPIKITVGIEDTVWMNVTSDDGLGGSGGTWLEDTFTLCHYPKEDHSWTVPGGAGPQHRHLFRCDLPMHKATQPDGGGVHALDG